MGLFGKKENKNEEKEKEKDFYEKSKNFKETLGQKLRKLFGGKTLDTNALEQIEETLITADIGPAISYDLIEKLRTKNIGNIEDAIIYLKNELKNYIFDGDIGIEKGQLNVLLVLGVNGVGKTTSIAKISNYYLQKGFKILLAAGDTFRAAAVEQLTKWSQRLDIPIIRQHDGADPASVVFDAIDSAKAKGVDLLIIDTAGRLHTKVNLMDELRKIEKIIKSKGDFNKKNLLVIDGTTGQNAFIQAESFNNAVGINGIMITKYDALSKGGIVFTIQKKLKIPFYFIGTGEKIENIEEFNKDSFIEKIFS
ncbi:MAG: signal recognition particle-docking protein FtsY [Spirochaetes bacterium GWD1_27_9]|nr:MAG: signal recognition particle-docking protein FtsY [Spirochaetes bacterium GWB1_27_13]OHD22311.1 MAG: signal recognition particle-docking protein FtsY [Spirochaetes bacterium GWC1_27_15]OHD34004.1 MAG: signal recognition particle-docking protein FtsY [Spirochaetes bacterium GWD1_27_9]